MLTKRKTNICVAISLFFENAHFESITKYAGFFELACFLLRKRKPKAQFETENGIQTKKTIIREQTTWKFMKSMPNNLK